MTSRNTLHGLELSSLERRRSCRSDGMKKTNKAIKAEAKRLAEKWIQEILEEEWALHDKVFTVL